MKIRWLVIFVAIVAILACACGKKKAEEAAVTEQPSLETPIEPALTPALVDTFIVQFPIVQKEILKRKESLGQVDPNNPAQSAAMTKALENIKIELAKRSIDVDRFFVVYQKVFYSINYIQMKDQVATIDTAKVIEEINRVKNLQSDPNATPEQKAQFAQQLTELESYRRKEVPKPEGITTQEVEVVRLKMPQLMVLSQNADQSLKTGAGNSAAPPKGAQTK